MVNKGMFESYIDARKMLWDVDVDDRIALFDRPVNVML
jgi:hypothetical protein